MSSSMASFFAADIKAGRSVRESFRQMLVDIIHIKATEHDRAALTALDADPSDENASAVFSAWMAKEGEVDND